LKGLGNFKMISIGRFVGRADVQARAFSQERAMMDSDIHERFDISDMTDLAALVARGDCDAGALLDVALERMGRVNPDLNAVVLSFEETARRKIEEGLPAGPFQGVPFLLKDLGAEAVDYPSHNGSRLLANTTYTGDSAIYSRLAASGLVVFGRTASPEGGIGAATEAAVYGGPTRNPWDPSRTPGGSSGGSGAAVAAGIVPGAHGSDGGGSVRIPASNCGLFGFKATRARLPDGPFAGEGWAGMAIDGFLTRSVRDQATLLDVCEGPDLGAPYVAPPLPHSFIEACGRQPRSLRVALCETSLTGTAVHADCAQAAREAAALLEELGHAIELVPRLPADTDAMMLAWCKIVACGTALWIDRKLEKLGRELRDDDVEPLARSARDYARTLSGADYLAAVETVHAYGREVARFFKTYDLLLTPTMAEPPACIGRFGHDRPDYLDYRMGPDGVFRYSPFTAAFNATGQPAASVPTHWTDEGLPVGIHLAAPYGADLELMSVCAQIEQARPWRHRKPDIWAGHGQTP
jgi:amidase/6-aminohexanoate-cyclic-dimer hydrolase